MHIKMSDMVIYNGRIVRLMTHRDSATRLKEGDLVIVDNIPQEEKDDYIIKWNHYKEDMVKSKEYYKIDMVMKTDYHGLVVKINNEWFAAYHVVPIVTYDMI